MNEDAMIQAAKRLGAAAADRLDVEATAQQVVARLREQPARRSTWIHAQWLRIAATVVLVMGGAFAIHQVWSTQGSVGHPAHFVADDLSGLSTDELQDVLDRFDEMISETGAAVPPEGGSDLHELDAQQLRRVLRSLEG
jgi:hypothetical protein